MTDNILQSVKNSLGLLGTDDSFDTEILIHVNSVFASLYELGIGPSDGFEIRSKSEKWSDYLLNEKRLNHVKSYVYLRVRLLFDPPQTAHAIGSFKEQVEKLEWMLTTTADEIARPPSVIGENP